MTRVYIAIDLKSFYASVECADRKLDPLTTNLVVADQSPDGQNDLPCSFTGAVSAAVVEHLAAGETVPAEHRLVAVPEGGYLTAALPRRAFPVKEGDTPVPAAFAAAGNRIERLQSVLKYEPDALRSSNSLMKSCFPKAG